MLTTKTILGAGWTVTSRLIGRLIDFVTVVVLARTLTPADFGLTALAMSLTVVVDTVLDVPLIQALTRLKCVTKSHLDTAFTLGFLRGTLLSGVVIAAAWPFSIIYNDNRLMALVAVLAIGPISRGLYSPGMVEFIREMNFRQVFFAEFTGKIIASIAAISLVYLGGGYWAIATSSVMSSAAATLITYLLAPYRPRFSLRNLRDFSAFLGWYSTGQVVSALSWQFDRVLLGYFTSKSNLGQFTMASDLSVLPTQSLIGPALGPVMAAFSRINDNRERLRNAFLKAARFTMMLSVPTSVGLSLTSDLIIDVLLGPKWNEAATYLQWLALSIVLSAYYQSLYSLALATNRPNIIFRSSLIELCTRIVLVSSGLYFYSLMGAIGARAAASLVLFISSLLYVRKLVGLSVATQLGNLWQIGAACFLMALMVLLFRYNVAGKNLHLLVELGLTAIFGAMVYVGALYALGVRLRGDIADLTNRSNRS